MTYNVFDGTLNPTVLSFYYWYTLVLYMHAMSEAKRSKVINIRISELVSSNTYSL